MSAPPALSGDCPDIIDYKSEGGLEARFNAVDKL